MGYRILVVTSSYPRPGHWSSGIFVKEQVDSLRALGLSIDVLHTTAGRGPVRYGVVAALVARQVRRWRYDLVHAHYGYAGLSAVVQRRTPAIITFHGSDLLGSRDARGRFAIKGLLDIVASHLAAPRAAEIIVVSDHMRRDAPRPDAHVIPCGVDFELFQPEDRRVARERLGLSPDRKFVLFPANPRIELKNFPLVDRAVSILRGRGIDAEILIPREVPHAEMPSYVNASDAVALASFTEGSPMVVKEAMGCGVPIVSTDVGDVADVIRGTEGCHIAGFDASEFAEKLGRSLAFAGPTTGRSAVAHLGLAPIARRIHDVYDRALGKGASRPRIPT